MMHSLLMPLDAEEKSGASNCPELTGQVIRPDHERYNKARLVANYYVSKNQKPDLIVYCKSTEDVQNAVKWARCHNRPIRIRSGGHNHEGFSIGTGAIVIDVSQMKNIEVDKEKSIAKLQPGITGGELYRALFKEGLTQVGGTCEDVGISGLILSGGMGPLLRWHGMSCDSLVSFEMVDAKGNVIQATFVEVNSGDPTPMAYFDGNTVTALWNYAQRFAMSDNCFSTTMTPSTPGHINLVSGQTHGAFPPNLTLSSGEIAVVDGTLIGDPDPAFDVCSKPPTVKLKGKNIGNLLNAKGITWGYFQGGFADCSKTHIGSKGTPIPDYSPHHQPFQYYKSTSNPRHLPPSSIDKIGFQDRANHQYDLKDFWRAAKIHQLPAVSFIKPPQYQDGHPKYSNQLLLQTFLVKTLNRLQMLPEWKEMAMIIVWDDSGGWYDHVMPPIINQSHTPADALLGPGDAGKPPPGSYQGRLAYGMRVPFLVISPFAKSNYVDHTVIDQTSILHFIQYNWFLKRIKDQSFDLVAGSILSLFNFNFPQYDILLLDPKTGLNRNNDCFSLIESANPTL